MRDRLPSLAGAICLFLASASQSLGVGDGGHAWRYTPPTLEWMSVMASASSVDRHLVLNVVCSDNGEWYSFFESGTVGLRDYIFDQGAGNEVSIDVTILGKKLPLAATVDMSGVGSALLRLSESDDRRMLAAMDGANGLMSVSLDRYQFTIGMVNYANIHSQMSADCSKRNGGQ